MTLSQAKAKALTAKAQKRDQERHAMTTLAANKGLNLVYVQTLQNGSHVFHFDMTQAGSVSSSDLKELLAKFQEKPLVHEHKRRAYE